MKFFTIVLLFVFTGCGFLDDDLFLDDEAFAEKLDSESIELDGLTLFGRGGGGYGYSSYGTYRFGVSGHSSYSSSRRQARTSKQGEEVDSVTAPAPSEEGFEDARTPEELRTHVIHVVDNNEAQKEALKDLVP